MLLCTFLGGCATDSTWVVETVAYRDGSAAVGVSAFYSDLAPYGEWLDLDVHGWVWTPYGVDVDWRPYTRGSWAWTNHGFTWASDWDWGWVCFHYGRWFFHPAHGWVWIPDRVWGPAWVDWRWGDGWIGWAPLPPSCVWRADVGVSWERQRDLDIVPHAWSFVEAGHFRDQDLRRRIMFSPYNDNLLRRTHRRTHYRLEEGRIVNASISANEIESLTGRRVEPTSFRTRRPAGKRAERDPAAGPERYYEPEVRRPVGARHPRPPATPNRTRVSTPAEIRPQASSPGDGRLPTRQREELERLERTRQQTELLVRQREAQLLRESRAAGATQQHAQEQARIRTLTEKAQRERALLQSWHLRENGGTTRRTLSHTRKYRVEPPGRRPLVIPGRRVEQPDRPTQRVPAPQQRIQAPQTTPGRSQPPPRTRGSPGRGLSNGNQRSN